MYSIISLISAWIRQFYLPNPFTTILTNSSYANIFNILIGGIILHVISYLMTGIYYKRGNLPSFGSLSYSFWYVINTFIFIGVGYLIHSIILYILVLIIIYLFLIILISYICNNI